MEIEKVFVIGAGTMGNGIAQICAQCGISVALSDVSQEMLEKAVQTIQWSVSKFIEKGKVSEELDTIMGRIKTSTKIDDAAEADLVIEAVFEKIEVKHQVFQKLDAVVGERVPPWLVTLLPYPSPKSLPL